jgi:cellulose synthase/poly-beta-1,6-N-acetylglucosamine synthase-like glycosyltransferase
VVPVLNAERYIGACLDALLSQDYPASAALDIIVVDNGSTDATRRLLDAYGSRIRVLDEPYRGASAARNAGIRAARHPLIAFTDADCIPCPDWLRELVAHALAHPEADFIGGAIRARPPVTDLARFVDTLFDQQKAIEVYTPPYVITANMLAGRVLLEAVGLFNPDFPRSQDVELSFRSGLRHGARFAYAPKAQVHHVHVDSLRGLYRKGLQHGAGAASIRREFLAELGPVQKRPGAHERPCRRLLRTSGALAMAMLKHRGRLPAGARVREDFYAALFRLGRHLGYARPQREQCGDNHQDAERTRGH